MLQQMIDAVRNCQNCCYQDDSAINDPYEQAIDHALKIVAETITHQHPYGRIEMRHAFAKLQLSKDIDGEILSRRLGQKWLEPYLKVGRGVWILSVAGLKRVKTNLHEKKPLIDEIRGNIQTSGRHHQPILFISEAPSTDAWEQQVLVDEKNIFLTSKLLPLFGISLEEFRKYFFWIHHTNCFPGTTKDGRLLPPKNNTCLQMHGMNFVTKIQWKGIILMGEYAFRVLNREDAFLDFLEQGNQNPSSQLFCNIPVMVVPHCSNNNTRAHQYLGSKFTEIWNQAIEFTQNIIIQTEPYNTPISSPNHNSTLTKITNQQPSPQFIAQNDWVGRIETEAVDEKRFREIARQEAAIQAAEFARAQIAGPDKDRRKILILGASQIRADEIRSIAKEYGLKDHIECHLDYRRNGTFNINTLQHSHHRYSFLLIGPHAHSLTGLGDYNSLLARLQNGTDGFPPHISLRNRSGELEINRKSLVEAFEEIKKRLTAEP